MTINDKVRNEKVQHVINREAAKISARSSEKIDKQKYLVGKEILPSDKIRIIEVAKFTYSPFGKASENRE